MIVLNTANRSLQLLLGGAVTTNQLPFVVNYFNTTREGQNHQNSANGLSNSTTVVTVLGAPTAGVKRTVQSFSIFNADTVNATVTVRLNDNATLRNIVVVTLNTGDHLIYTTASGWFVLSASGFIKSTSTAVNLDDLGDVQITAPAIGATLIYNGTNWVDGALDLADADARTGILPVANGGTGVTTSTGTVNTVLSTSPSLTTPAIAGGTLIGLTGLALRDTSAAFDVTIAATSAPALTVARTLTIDMSNDARLIDLAGNLTVSATATVSGTNTGDQTITLTGDVTGSGTGSFATTIAAGAVSLTTDVSGILPLANGGTNANLTASNGGIFYSTASAGAVLAGTATAGQILRSGLSAAPSWSTATYPATVTANRLLYGSAANVVSETGAGLTFDGTTLTANTLTVSTGALTASANAGHVIGSANPGDQPVTIHGGINFGRLSVGDANAYIDGPPGEIVFRNNAVTQNNLRILDNGNLVLLGTLTVTGASTLSGALTYGGVALSNAVTGTGNMVLSISPTFTTSLIAASTTMALLDTVATTINFAGAATALTVGATTGFTNVRHSLFVNDTGNADMTIGVTINQGANANHILALKSSDIAHGITSFAETDTYGYCDKFQALLGGLRIVGLSEDSVGLVLNGFHTTDITTKTTGAQAAVKINSGLKLGTGITDLGANANILSVRNNDTTRFILDADGDSHQDVGTAWTNFDHLDDVAILEALSYNVSRHDDPIKRKFGKWMLEKRPELEQERLVTFNDDGHHFVNMSRLTMLHTGAIQQLGKALNDVNAEIARLRAIEYRLAVLEDKS